MASSDLRVVFMGTPDFAVSSLKAVLDAGYTVPLVVSVPDRPQGRGRQLHPSPVKQLAIERGIPVAQPERLKDPEFLETLRAAQPDVICVVAFRILPPEVFTIPRLGSFNLHASLLPRYRGAAPINRAIMAGERESGVTTFFLQRAVDTGSIILQKSVPIGKETTAGELHDALMTVGAELVVETLRLIERGEAHPSVQDDALATPAPKIFREDCVIDWERSTREIVNQIRGLSPYPAAFTTLRGQTFKIRRAHAVAIPFDAPSGTLRAEDGHLFIRAGDGTLELLEVQIEGRRSMPAEEFLRGFTLHPGERCGSSTENIDTPAA